MGTSLQGKNGCSRKISLRNMYFPSVFIQTEKSSRVDGSEDADPWGFSLVLKYSIKAIVYFEQLFSAMLFPRKILATSRNSLNERGGKEGIVFNSQGSCLTTTSREKYDVSI